MVFRDYTYSILLVCSSEKLNNAVRKLLPVNLYWPMETAATAGEARRMLAERQFDLILISSPLPDENGIGLSMDICDQSMSGVLLLVREDQYAEVCDRVTEHGVMVLSKPLTDRSLLRSLQLLCSIVARMKRMMEKQSTVEEKIDEIRVINHAKWLLIEHEELTEPEAHRRIERQAMNERSTKRKVAEAIIARYETDKKTPPVQPD